MMHADIGQHWWESNTACVLVLICYV